ncbi:hypothetical protein ACLKA7_013558 [Drosophila subpalustris]
MADEDLSPLPFRRERNLSNRNFNKRNSRRRSSQLSTELERHSSGVDAVENSSSSSSSFQLSYSVNSDTESAFNRRSLLKMRAASDETAEQSQQQQPQSVTPTTPTTPTADPALLDVRQKVQRFETLKSTISYMRQERLSLKLLENRHRPSFSQCDFSAPLRTPPVPRRIALPGLSSRTNSISSAHISIDEVRSEDEVDQISDFETDPTTPVDYVLGESSSEVISSSATDPEEHKSQTVQRSISADPSQMPLRTDKDFPR